MKVRTINLSVTEIDIAQAEARSANRCPIARALNRACPGFRAIVGRDTYSLQRESDLEIFEGQLPLEACRFTMDVDSGGKVSPLTFPVEVPA